MRNTDAAKNFMKEAVNIGHSMSKKVVDKIRPAVESSTKVTGPRRK